LPLPVHGVAPPLEVTEGDAQLLHNGPESTGPEDITR